MYAYSRVQSTHYYLVVRVVDLLRYWLLLPTLVEDKEEFSRISCAV